MSGQLSHIVYAVLIILAGLLMIKFVAKLLKGIFFTGILIAIAYVLVKHFYLK